MKWAKIELSVAVFQRKTTGFGLKNSGKHTGLLL